MSKEIQRDKVRRARAMPLDERLTAGAKLYAEQLRLVREMIAGLQPEWTEADVDAEMKRRRSVIRERCDKQFYCDKLPDAQTLANQT